MHKLASLPCIGSTAGAGSGEFHVFRAARRREFTRQAYMEEKSKEVGLKGEQLAALWICLLTREALQEEEEEEFRRKRAAIEAELDEKTAKKRAKRQKKKEACRFFVLGAAVRACVLTHVNLSYRRKPMAIKIPPPSRLHSGI